MNPTKGVVAAVPEKTPATGRDSLTITDNRTGKTYELPIKNETIRAIDLRQIKVNEKDFGMISYDPAFTNTASCTSRITYIDGDAGILRYRGYPIEELAEKSTYLETAYLILYGELPTREQLKDWTYNITHHTFIHESIKKFLDGFHYDAHPMGMLISTVAALSTFYPDAKDIFNPESRRKQTYRLIGKMPTLSAFAYRHSLGMPLAYPDNELSYSANFLNMLFRTTELKYRANPTLERALDILFILHADHEQNCSSTAMRGVGSSHVDPYSAIAAATAALYGPLHGGANEAVLRMLLEIGSVGKVPDYIKSVKAGERHADGLRAPRVQELRPARDDREAHRLRSIRRDGPQSDDRYRAGVRADRARGRLFRYAQALSERGFLHGPDLPIDGLPGDDVPCAVRDSAHVRMDRAVGRNAARPGAKNRAAAAGLSRRGRSAATFPSKSAVKFRCHAADSS